MSGSSLKPSRRHDRTPPSSGRSCDYGEGHVSRDTYENVKEDLQVLRARLERKDQELTEYHNLVAEKERLYDEARDSLLSSENQVRKLESEAETATLDYDKLVEEYNDLSAREKALVSKINGLHEQLHPLKRERERSQQLDEQVKRLKTEGDHLRQRLSVLESHEDKVKRLEQELADERLKSLGTFFESVPAPTEDSQIIELGRQLAEERSQRIAVEKLASSLKSQVASQETRELEDKVQDLSQQLEEAQTHECNHVLCDRTEERLKKELAEAVRAFSSKNELFKTVQRRNQTLRIQVDGFRELWSSVTGGSEGDFDPDDAASDIGEHLAKLQQQASVFIQVFNELTRRGIANIERDPRALVKQVFFVFDDYLNLRKSLDDANTELNETLAQLATAQHEPEEETLAPFIRLHSALEQVTPRTAEKIAQHLSELIWTPLVQLYHHLPHGPDETLVTPQGGLETALDRVLRTAQRVTTTASDPNLRLSREQERAARIFLADSVARLLRHVFPTPSTTR